MLGAGAGVAAGVDRPSLALSVLGAGSGDEILLSVLSVLPALPVLPSFLLGLADGLFSLSFRFVAGVRVLFSSRSSGIASCRLPLAPSKE